MSEKKITIGHWKCPICDSFDCYCTFEEIATCKTCGFSTDSKNWITLEDMKSENAELRKQKQADDYLYQQAKTQCETAFRQLENLNAKYEFLIGKVSEIVANSITPRPIIIQNNDMDSTDE